MSAFYELGLVLKCIGSLKEDWERLTDEQKLFKITEIEWAIEVVREGQLVK